jgi:sporulation protein YlmC with PRC-barrel domain
MLRRLRDFENFEVWSQTGRDIGRVDDFYFDEDRWTVRYVVVKTGGWLTGQSVLLSPMSIERLQWDHARIEFGLTEDQIRHAPSADLSQPISREWESEYSAYYSLPGYWVGPSGRHRRRHAPRRRRSNGARTRCPSPAGYEACAS